MSRFLTLAVGALLSLATPAYAGSPGLDAIKEFRAATPPRPSAIENRFFLKEGRFEIAPMFGAVPNNPFASRIVGGALMAYHFNEQIAADAFISYSPDLGNNDLKGLTKTLVQIAKNGSGDSDFQQPLDKITLSAQFAARWSPVYGKINLVGETVVNFDFYGVAGLGMVSKANYYACAPDPNDPNCQGDASLGAIAKSQGNEVKVTPLLGVGGNFFLNQTVSLKLDLRMAFYVDNLPDYNPNDNQPVTRQRSYNQLVAAVGVGFFFPRMKPRLYNF